MSLSAHLNALESSGFIGLARSQPDVEYLFRHSLVQDAAYASLLKADRLALHRAAGEALERLYPERLAEFAAQLGQHFYLAGEDRRALTYLAQAGAAAMAVYANSEAVQHYSRAIEVARHILEAHSAGDHERARLPRHADAPRPSALAPQAARADITNLQNLYLQCGRALELSNRYPDAVALYREMADVAERQGDRSLLLASMLAGATARLAVGAAFDPAQGQALIERALSVARELGDRQAEAKIAWQQMMFYMYSRRMPDALALGEQALALARELNLREQVGFVLNDLSRAYLADGQVKSALRVLVEAEALSREIGDLPLLADSLAMMTGVRHYLGQFAEALRLGAEADQISHRANNDWGKAVGGQVGLTLLELGDFDAGRARLEQVLSLSERGRYGFGMSVGAAYLAQAYEMLGAFDRALELARRAVANTEVAFPTARDWVLPVLGRMLLANGRVAEAQAVLQGGGPARYQSPLQHTARETDCLMALALGEYVQAVALAERAIAADRSGEFRVGLMGALALKGRGLVAAARPAEARGAYQEARAIAEEIGSRRALWPILAALARLAAAQGRHAEAYELRREARTVLEYIADHIASADLRASLFSLPDAREVMGTS